MSDLIVEPTKDPLIIAVSEQDIFLVAESTGSVIIAPEGETVVLVEQPAPPPFIHVIDDGQAFLTAADIGPKGDKGDKGDQGVKGDTGAASTVPGPKGDKGDQGEPGYVPPKGPEFTYTGSELTGILYDDGSTKTLSYNSGKLSQVVFVRDGVTSTKTFVYTGDQLTRIDEVIT